MAQQQPVGNIWSIAAERLAAWALERLVNRTDAWGGYYRKFDKSTQQTETRTTTRKEDDVVGGSPAGPLDLAKLTAHFRGRHTDHIVGVHALGPDGFGKWVGFDVDAHDDQVDVGRNENYARFLFSKLSALGFKPLMYSSNGRGGFHVWVLFDSPVPGPLLHSFAAWSVADCTSYGIPAVEANPKQPFLTPSKRYGNWLRLPGRHHTRDHWPVLWNGSTWLTPDASVSTLLGHKGNSWTLIPETAFPEPEPEPTREQTRRRDFGNSEPPWVTFNRTADFAAMLRADGAKAGTGILWIRPGKDSGPSATLGFRFDKESGCPLLFNWSPNWYGLAPGKFYTPFDFEVSKRFGRITSETNRQTIEALRAEGKIPYPPGSRPSAKSAEVRTSEATDSPGEAPGAKPEPGGAPPPPAPPSPRVEGEFERPQRNEVWTDPHRLARTFAARFRTPQGESTLVHWRAEYHTWCRGAWSLIPEADLKASIARHCRTVFEADLPIRIAENPDPDKPIRLPAVTSRVRGDTLTNLEGIVNLPDRGEDAPFWIQAADNRPDPVEVISAPNGLFTISDIAEGLPAFHTPTPGYFTPNALSFDVPPASSPPPSRWLDSLRQWFNGDQTSMDALQEWFGYLLSSSTEVHKILMIVGPARSGKGTIIRILTALVGVGNVASTSFSRLGESFGLEPLLGKKVAVIPDGRVSGRIDAVAVVERLLSVSGEDAQPVNRKNRQAISTRLRTRFVIASNEVPRLPDASGAVATRFDILNTPNSYLGREDHGLTDKLTAELPGILLWAAAGWSRLKANGMRFTPVATAADYARQLEDLASPIKAFIRERCSIGPRYSVDVHELYSSWKSWNDEQNRSVSSEQLFGRDLKAAVPHVKVQQSRRGEGRVRCYAGIALRNPIDWGEEETTSERVPTRDTSSEPSSARSGTRAFLTQRERQKDEEEMRNEAEEQPSTGCVSPDRVPSRDSDPGEEAF